MSEERTVRLGSRQAWNSEDTQLCSCKVFFAVAGCFIGERTDKQHFQWLSCSEAECIVFAMEGLLLAHDLCSTAESGLSATQGQLITTGNDHDAPFISGAMEDAAPRGYHRAIAQQNPAWPDDFWAPMKFIPLDIAHGSYLNFGGELRERVEHFSRPFFGLTPRGTTTYDMHRLLLSGDLHIGDTFRTFIQLGNHEVTSPSMSPPTDVDHFDLQQAFLDLKASIGQDASLTFRGGRQEITFGGARLVDVREGPNIRLSFDGGRVFYESPALRIDAFGVAPVVAERGVFDDRSIGREAFPGKAFWGLYSVIPVGAVPGLHTDLYYLGLIREQAPYDSGVANERRHSLGARFWGRAEAWDCDIEGVFQFGDFGSRNIRAWTVASNTGYTLASLWGEPRLGLQADVASGGGPGKTLKTFNPLFPKFAYFTEASINSPINFIDVFPCPAPRTRSVFSVRSPISKQNGRRPHISLSTPPMFTF